MTSSVIVVGHGREPLLEACLTALLADLSAEDELVLVDNGVIVLPDVDGIRVVGTGENLGFAAGARLGVDHTTGDRLVFVNSDAVVRPGAVSALAAALDDPTTGLVCGRVELADEPGVVNSVGNPVHLTGLSWAGGFGDPVADHTTPRDVAAVTGALFATRRDVWDALGGMHDDYFLYYEDTDLSLRAWLAGFRVRYVPDAVAVHRYEFARNRRKMFRLERNRLASVLTAFPTPLLRRVLPVVLLTEPLLLAVAVRDGWGREKVAGWWWLVRHAGALRRRRRAIPRPAPHALDALLTTRLSARQVDAPPGLPLLDRLVTAYWHRTLAARPWT